MEYFEISKTELHSRLVYFVQQFVAEFEGKGEAYFEQATNKSRKAGRSAETASTLVGGIDETLPGASGPLKVLFSGVGSALQKTKAEHISGLVEGHREGTLRKILVSAGVDLFLSLESQFARMKCAGGWRVGVRLVAMDFVERGMNYFHDYLRKHPDLQLKLGEVVLVKGVLLGKSKRDFDKFRRVVFRQRGAWATSGLLDKVGLVVIITHSQKDIYYQRRGRPSGKYGFRRLFSWESSTSVHFEGYAVVEVDPPPYKYLLLQEDLPKLKTDILRKLGEVKGGGGGAISEIQINEMVQKSVTALREPRPIQFDVVHPTPLFTGRGNMLKRLHSALKSSWFVYITQTEVALSASLAQVAGSHLSLGKSELVKKYMIDFGTFFNSNLIWIDATNYDSTEESLLRLIEAYFSGISPVDEEGWQKGVTSLWEEICTEVKSKVKKCLFVFDNVTDDPELNFEGICTTQISFKLHAVATSRLGLRDAFVASKFHLLELGPFSWSEAGDFVSRSLEPYLGPQEEDHVRSLVGLVGCHPSNLKKAVSFIKSQNKKFHPFSIGDYLRMENVDLLDGAQKRSAVSREADDDSSAVPPLLSTLDHLLRHIWTATLDSLGSSESDQWTLKILQLLAFVSPHSFLNVDCFTASFPQEFVQPSLEKLSSLKLISLESGQLRVDNQVQAFLRQQIVPDMGKTILMELVSIFQTSILSEDGSNAPECNCAKHFSYVWTLVCLDENLVLELHKHPMSILNMYVLSGRIRDAAHFGGQMCRKFANSLGRESPIAQEYRNSYSALVKQTRSNRDGQ